MQCGAEINYKNSNRNPSLAFAFNRTRLCNISFWLSFSPHFFEILINLLTTAMEQFNLNWHTNNDHLRELMLNLMLLNESTDGTLVCKDKTKFKAHKSVLNSCIPVFQFIISDLPQ